MKNALSHTALFGMFLFFCSWFMLAPAEVHATQVHEGAEGLYAHQIGHVFFLASMGILVFWLRSMKLVRQTGWRYIQYAALFFMLYNLDAMLAHYLDGLGDLFEKIDTGTWRARIQFLHGQWELGILYYIVKMDHLLSVPAVVFLYAGLRHLLRDAKVARAQEQES